jgi:hypothetical protein
MVSLIAGTGEHGVGIGKKKYLLGELGEGTVELMSTVKRAVDPLNLFNPGKVNTHTNFHSFEVNLFSNPTTAIPRGHKARSGIQSSCWDIRCMDLMGNASHHHFF